jgi:hypothetical protein
MVFARTLSGYAGPNPNYFQQISKFENCLDALKTRRVRRGIGPQQGWLSVGSGYMTLSNCVNLAYWGAIRRYSIDAGARA